MQLASYSLIPLSITRLFLLSRAEELIDIGVAV